MCKKTGITPIIIMGYLSSIALNVLLVYALIKI